MAHRNDEYALLFPSTNRYECIVIQEFPVLPYTADMPFFTTQHNKATSKGTVVSARNQVPSHEDVLGSGRITPHIRKVK
jgi:hypothetical protein